MIEGHGDDRHNYGALRADFSSNVPAGVDLTGLREHLRARLDLVGRYPEPEPRSLERALAERCGVSPDAVIVTNGATEAIYLTAHLLAGGHAAVAEPTFAEYGDACRLYGCTTEQVPDPYDPPREAGSLWCCNPNNPTGRAWERERLLRAADARPGTLFVVDQSYEAFTLRPLLTPAEAAGRPNVALIRSMTKHYAVPGLRLGYLVAAPALCERLRRLRMPWSVNALAIEAGRYLLREGAPSTPLAELLHERERLAAGLKATGKLRTEPTDTHFMLAELLHGTAAELKEWLARERGILIRDASNFRGLTPRHIRIAAQSPADNDLLTEAFASWNPNRPL